MAVYELPKLPYGLGDLAPQISKETMEYHYLKHHQAYIDNLNKMIQGTEYENMPLEEIILKSDGGVFNNAAQTWNHTFFFLGMRPEPKPRPENELSQMIDRDFGSFDEFKEKFLNAAKTQFASGWAWLAMDNDGKLSVFSTSNADNPMTRGLKPLVCLDVWEHAYYIDYRNKRPDFVSAAWEKICWSVIEERFAANK